MATPATIQIEDRLFYCHYDGMPTGMAPRLVKTIEALAVPLSRTHHRPIVRENARGGLAFAFIRGNLDAEPAPHNSRSGIWADYHYSISSSDTGELSVKVERRTDRSTWRIIEVRELASWIHNQRSALASQIRVHAPESTDPNADALVAIPAIVKASACGRRASPRFEYATREQARSYQSRAEGLAGRFSDDNPNHQVCLDQAGYWEAALVSSSVDRHCSSRVAQ